MRPVEPGVSKQDLVLSHARQTKALMPTWPTNTPAPTRPFICDAISFLLMRDSEISEALSTERHFEQAGFIRLLRPTA